MYPSTTIYQVKSLARRARLASTSGQTLEVKLSPEESATLALFLEELLPDEQDWFWTAEWQAGEQAAERDLVEGRYQDFETMEEMLLDLGWQP